tara:strand:- start:1814 stop:2026 length:213 start_codon:yes stop_codon:yes gene_type:complete
MVSTLEVGLPKSYIANLRFFTKNRFELNLLRPIAVCGTFRGSAHEFSKQFSTTVEKVVEILFCAVGLPSL